MQRDEQRIGWVIEAIKRVQLDALVCAAPENVLMLTGYWPVTGVAVAIVSAGGKTAILAPADEEDLARRGWADEVQTFEPASLQDLRSTVLAVDSTLNEALLVRRLNNARLGYEHAAGVRPSSYVAQQFYCEALREGAREAAWGVADDLLKELRRRLSAGELARLRLSCQCAKRAYMAAKFSIQPGMTEADAASALHRGLTTDLDLDLHRTMGFAFCMSGPNAYQAYAAYQRSRSRVLEEGDLVLLHCNSCVDGFWTDITRTFVLGQPDDRQSRIHQAMLEARSAALAKIRPGVIAAEVDRAARDVMKAHGFGKEFKHPTGHGVGFTAIDHNAQPRIHPLSSDVLEEGMVFNVEPGLYIEGYGGARHCDMVCVTSSGCELLTDFLSDASELVLPFSR